MTFRTLTIVGTLAALCGGCGAEEPPYEPEQAYTGKQPNLPAVPTLPNKAKKEGNAYTVWGAMHDLHSIVHQDDFDGKDTTIVGWIVRTNWETLCEDEFKPEPGEVCVPECAIHETGEADPADCEPPVPTFWIAESKDESNPKKMIQVMGFSSNFAQMYTLIDALETDDEAELEDEFFAHDLPKPLPAKGGKIKVTGAYGTSYQKGSGPAASNPRTGIVTWKKQEWVEPPPEPATLPGM